MEYVVLIKKQAQKFLQSLPRPDRIRIAEKIKCLERDPYDSLLDVKPLLGESYYRLRVGNWCIIFDRDDEIRVIAIEKIKSRGGAYK